MTLKLTWLHRPVPRSLFGRAALILIVPIVAIQLVVSVVFIQRHFEGVTRQMTSTISLEIDYLLRQVDAASDSPSAKAAAAALEAPLAIQVDWPAEAGPDAPPPADLLTFVDLSGRYVIDGLRDALQNVRGVDLVSQRGQVMVWLDTRYGLIEITLDRSRVSASNPHQLLVLMIFTSLLMTLIAYAFLRNQLRPITKMAEAAEAFGKGRSLPYRPRGANEVRAAGQAFLDMRNRIERQIEQRTLMLSGVSHDLRTPLTRLKLGLEMADDTPETAALKRDVVDMEQLLEAFLAFARGDAMDDPLPTNPVALAALVVENARRSGQPVMLVAATGQSAGQQPVMMRPQAVTRALENLVNNAVRYGSHAEVSVAVTDRAVRFSVEDDGPGIPKDRRDEALRPFTRLDPSRNQNKGSGVGLGLSIAFDIARSHGGTLRWGDSEVLGGLKAELVLAR